jgi:maleylpyruvate isomerase
LVDDVEATSDAVVARMDEVADWSGSVRAVTAERPKAMLPHLRRREVEIHRIDLGLGYTFADLPGEFVRSDARLMEMLWKARQPMGLTPLPQAVLHLAEHDRLAWLLGRLEVDGVEPAGVF